ncbi:unnamed protein product [Parnassius apollo]|uniref:(apollo) hypothetical protein n=1 Tax=Parnassius apollo TaxID=110799 RepID=A0A8S3XLX5_PARAO|nr:unnamed protein product [Parnassius apollo]
MRLATHESDEQNIFLCGLINVCSIKRRSRKNEMDANFHQNFFIYEARFPPKQRGDETRDVPQSWQVISTKAERRSVVERRELCIAKIPSPNDISNSSEMDVTHVHESDVQESEEVRGYHDLERKKACIFCDKSSHRRVRMRNEPLSISEKWENWENYLVDAVNSENFEKVVTIRSYLDNKILYHKTCLNDYRSVLAKKSLQTY